MADKQENTEPTATNPDDVLSASDAALEGSTVDGAADFIRADDVGVALPIERDPADEIPVPIAMSPAEIDERAQAVEAVRGSAPADLPQSLAASGDAEPLEAGDLSGDSTRVAEPETRFEI